MVAQTFNADRSRWARGYRDDGIARSAAAWIARRRFGYPATTLAEARGYRGPSSVTQALHRAEQEHTHVAATLGRIERRLAND